MNLHAIMDAIKVLKKELGGGLHSICLTEEVARDFDLNMEGLTHFPDDPPREPGHPWEINGVKVFGHGMDDGLEQAVKQYRDAIIRRTLASVEADDE